MGAVGVSETTPAASGLHRGVRVARPVRLPASSLLPRASHLILRLGLRAEVWREKVRQRSWRWEEGAVGGGALEPCFEFILDRGPVRPPLPQQAGKGTVESRWTPRGPNPGSLCLLAKDGWSSGLSVPKEYSGWQDPVGPGEPGISPKPPEACPHR